MGDSPPHSPDRSYTILMSLGSLDKQGRGEVPLNLYRVSSPGIARVVSNERLTPPDHDDVRHIVLDLDGLDYGYLEGQSLGVLAPGTDAQGRAHKLRLYSIASTRLGDDGQGRTASLCVKRVIYQDPATGQERRGVASNYLCDLEPGATVAVTGPAGKTFLMPEEPASNLILVATGTGIAPFRAFLRRIYLERPEWTAAAVHKFFGARTAAECLYREELEAFLDEPGFRLSTAFSREQATADGQRMYVQHRMAEQIGTLWDLLQRDDTYLYICGLKGMEDGINAVLEAHAEAKGVPWAPFRDALRKSGRILIETY
jgi:ferredoxin--NADP+ reductase